MKLILFLLGLILAQTISAQQRPNIILILADDLGWGDVGYQGQRIIRTPNIDKLAAGGMRFTQFYAGTAVCAPSRASLMTGLHTGHTPIRGNRGFQPEGQYPLPDSSVTIASVLRDRGYATGAFGKWGLGYPGSTGVPDKQGFDKFYGYNCQTLAHDYYPDHLWDNDKMVHLGGTTYSADLIHLHAMRFIDDNKGRPFFLFLAYTIPHAQLQVPHDSVYSNYLQQLHDSLHASYAAMVTRLDRYVGEVVEKVRTLGLAGNTLILFSSDNGPHKEGGGDPDFFHSSGAFRGIKRDLYEGGIREPFIAYWPGKIKAGATSDHTGAFWDLFPTFADVAGVPVNRRIDGLSILPVLKGQQAAQHEYLYWEFHENGGRQAVRWGKWKGVRLNVGKEADGPVELYDLETDPGEKKNVANQHQSVVQSIKTFMAQAHQSNKDWPLLATEQPKP
jgi:arylsulfatase A